MKKMQDSQFYIKELKKIWYFKNVKEDVLITSALRKYLNLHTLKSKYKDDKHILSKKLWIQQDHACYYCKRILLPKDITLDHTEPHNRSFNGGEFVVSCKNCNNLKGDMPQKTFIKYMETAQNKLTSI